MLAKDISRQKRTFPWLFPRGELGQEGVEATHHPGSMAPMSMLRLARIRSTFNGQLLDAP